MSSMPLSKASAVDAAYEHFPSFLRSRQKAKLLDSWQRGEQYNLDPNDLDDDSLRFAGRPYRPRAAEVTDEFDDLAERSPNAFAGLVVTSLAQTAYVDGMRMPGSESNMKAWDTWQANRWDAKQGPIHRTAIGIGEAFGVTLPGKNPLTGDKMARMLARSPKRMAAFWDNDDDEWCMFAIDAVKVYEFAQGLGIRLHTGWSVQLIDEKVVHFLSCKGDGQQKKDWTYIETRDHGVPVPPVARLANKVDLDGRTTGEIEPVLPLLRRIDQGTFDRLIVQRFGAWKVRYIAGMAKPTGNDAQATMLAMSLADFLVSPDHETKFGSIDSTDPKPFADLTDADLRMLSAITQTPPHHLLGLSSNLQAEALAAAESGLQRKSADFKMNAGEFHEQMARLTALINGDREEANAFNMQVRWRDTESRSLTQAAQALGTMAVQLKIPVEMLWERLPGWTDMDTERAKSIVEKGGIDQLLAEIAGGLGATDGDSGPTENEQPKKSSSDDGQ